MGSDRSSRGRARGQSWFSALLGVAVLTSGGFLLGLIVGVVSEEPELIVGHVAGRSEEIAWASDTAPVSAKPSRGQAAAAGTARESEGRPSGESARSSAPPVSAPAKSAAAESYAIQVGAFAENESAERLATRLRDRGYAVLVLPPETDNRWRVRVGPVGGRDEAERVARQLKTAERLPTWVLSEPGR